MKEERVFREERVRLGLPEGVREGRGREEGEERWEGEGREERGAHVEGGKEGGWEWGRKEASSSQRKSVALYFPIFSLWSGKNWVRRRVLRLIVQFLYFSGLDMLAGLSRLPPSRTRRFRSLFSSLHLPTSTSQIPIKHI